MQAVLIQHSSHAMSKLVQVNFKAFKTSTPVIKVTAIKVTQHLNPAGGNGGVPRDMFQEGLALMNAHVAVTI